MRLGVNIGYVAGAGSPGADEHVQLAVEAERLGYDVCWAAEAYGSDAPTLLAFVAARTQRMHVGSAIMQIPARTPAMTAMTAATLDTLSKGRFRLGLGVSGPQVSEGWHGVSFRRPVTRTREYVEIVRAALAREGPLTYEGKEFRLPVEGSELGKPLKLLIQPERTEIPVYLGAVGPRAIEQTGEIADGWLPFMFSPEHAEQMLAPVRASGRSVDVAPVVPVCVAGDEAAARDLARPWLSIYLGGMGAKDKNFYVDMAATYGHGESAREVQDRFLGGDRDGAAAALSDELIDSSAICTTAAKLDDRLADYDRAGADTLLAIPFGDRPAIVRALGAVDAVKPAAS